MSVASAVEHWPYLLLVVEEVVCHVVASISKDASCVRGKSSVPIPRDDGVCELPEWGC